MTDIIMCQKIYGQRERRGEKKLESTFSRSSSFKLLSLALSTCLSEMLEAVETHTHTERERWVNEGPVKYMI